MIDHTPKVFISYAWTNAYYQKQIISIAEQLRSDGIDVILDVWDLKKGNDKYQFMEQCVTDSSIDKVLIFSNKTYTEKANNRKGGVGDETAVITPDIYGKNKQDKYIPVIMERDNEGGEFLPTYLKRIVYTDFTNPDTYEDEYHSLVKLIYGVSEYRKPKIGMVPTWLDEEKSDNTQDLRRIIRRTNTLDTALIDEFQSFFIEKLRPFYKKEYKETKIDNSIVFEMLSDIDKTKDLRDVYLDFVRRIISIDNNSGEVIGDMLEKLYNSICHHRAFTSESIFYTYSIDIFKYLCWEILICSVALLLHFERYKDLHDLLCRTYFLNVDFVSVRIEAVSYGNFYSYSEYLEKHIKPRTENYNLFTLAGNILCTSRQNGPLLSSNAIATADLFLYQVFPGFLLENPNTRNYWFPVCYVYSNRDNSIWKKLVSRRYCKKMYALFGVNSLEDFKNRLKKCIEMEPFGYQNSYNMAPTIKSYIKFEQIGIYE